MPEAPSPKRVLVVGGVAGGASFAARLRRMDESAEIVIYEKGPHVSFANCGLPYHVGGVIEREESLLVASPEKFESWFGIPARTMHEVVSIDRAARTVRVKDHRTGREFDDSYTHLLLSPGASPIRPPLPGIDSEGIFTVRNVPDAAAVRRWIPERGAKRAVIVGGGYIGLEMLENLVHLGLHCTVIELADQVMAPADKEMMAPIHASIRAKGVDLRLGEMVTGFEQAEGGGLSVLTKGSGAFPADLVVLSIGVRPLVDLAKGAGLELGERGGIKVDAQMRTSDPAIFAVGDAVEVVDFVTGAASLIPLAGPANRQGRVAADAIAGRADAAFRGVQGTAVCGLFEHTIAMTGLTEKAAKRAGIAHEKAYLFPGHHVGYYPGAEPIFMKLLFDPSSGRVLGAQAVGKAGVEKRIDVVAMAIQFKGTVFDLEEAELCYAPQYGSAKDPVNMAGFIAANHLRGDAPLEHFADLWTGDAPDGAMVLDVRTKAEFDRGHLPGAVNIPLQELRARVGEVPTDRPVLAHCGVGIRSHNAVRILRQAGVDARNLSGGWTMASVVEQALGPIPG